MLKLTKIKKVVIVCLSMLMVCSSLKADVLDKVPSDSLFCVRINGVDKAFGSVDQFAMDISPMPMMTTALIRGQMAGLIGDPMLKNIDMNSSFAIFGRMSEQGIFIGILMPVTDYSKFVSENEACTDPDLNGVSNFTKMNNPEDVRAATVDVGGYALITPKAFTVQLPSQGQAIKTLNSSLNSLASQSSASPFWAYANIQSVSPIVKPMIDGALEQMKSELENAKQQEGMPFDPSQIVNMYAMIIEGLLEEVSYVSLNASPDAEKFAVKFNMTAVEGSTLANMLKSSSNGPIKSLGYLEDGAFMNVAAKVDKEMMKEMYDGFFEIFEAMSVEGVSDNDIEEMQKLTNDSIDCLGDNLAFSMNIKGGQPPFSFKYIFAVDDVDRYNKIMERSIEMMNNGLIKNFYKGFGMDLDFKFNQEVGSYKGIEIASLSLDFGQSGNTDMDQMIEKLYGEGLEYRFATFDNKLLMTVADDSDAAIKKEIDKLLANQSGPGPICSEIKAAMNMLSDADKADVIGTINIVRVMTEIDDLVKIFEPGQDLGTFDFETRSNIAFSGKTDNGSTGFELVVPKAHIMEIITAGKAIDQMEREKREAVHSN